MRRSTAAGISISLLPQDAAARDFPMGICRWCRPGKGPLFLAFVEFPVALSGKRPLFPGIFGIRHIRYRRGASGVRNMRAVRKNPLLWYAAHSEALRAQNRLLRYGRNIRCAKQPSVVRESCCV